MKLPTIIREEMELIGLETDLIVVKALQPGNLVVRSQCLEREYENIFDEVTISVHESFELYPPGHTLLVIGSIFQFSLNHLNGDAINLPKQYYRITGGSKFKISEILLVTAPYERS